MAARDPQTDHGRNIRAQVSEARWARVVAEADERASFVEAVIARQAETSASWRSTAAAVAPQLPWPTFVKWKRHYDERTGPAWERLLDGRVPPDTSVGDDIEMAARLLRQLDPQISVQDARAQLTRMFDDRGKVSGSWLKRVWAEAGLNRVGGPVGPRQSNETPESFHGGAGLALLAAAEAETGSTLRLARSVLQAGGQAAGRQSLDEVVDDHADRDDRGRFTADYNARRRADADEGHTDDRWTPDAVKAQRRDLSTLATLSSRPHVLVSKLLAMGATPLLTERRGFDGLDGPAGEWLAVMGGTAYMPATLDKALAELALLGVDDAMWRTHARGWSRQSARWREPDIGWQRSVVYIDGTADPYWTRAFAASGKVSRVGRVMPCLTRVAIHSGEGVPLLVETHVGAVSLKKRLLPMLQELDRAVGPRADIGRLSVVDSEAGTAGTIWAMHDQTEMLFVTVLKGAVLSGALMVDPGPWQPFRERDQVRDLQVHLRGKDAPEEGIWIRGVEMHRDDGRRPQSTVFATNAVSEDLGPVEVASWYLGRWPKQEQLFATGRNGGGLNRSHGYGGEYVTHVALAGKLERAERSVQRARSRQAKAEQTRDELADALADASARTRKQALTLADRAVRDRQREQATREKAKARADTLPQTIYARDTTRDGVMTCLKLNVLSLLEFVLHEYFGGLGMHWRTFIEQFVALPVQVRSSTTRCVYSIQANGRQPERMDQLRGALDEVNRRRLKRGKQLLVFELVAPDSG